MVRLEDTLITRLVVIHSNFNSSMVRLEALYTLAFICQSNRFQFQYGAIRRIIAPGKERLNFEFQFQYGAIRRYTYNEAGGDSFKFQFQYGAIRSVIKMLQKE